MRLKRVINTMVVFTAFLALSQANASSQRMVLTYSDSANTNLGDAWAMGMMKLHRKAIEICGDEKIDSISNWKFGPDTVVTTSANLFHYRPDHAVAGLPGSEWYQGDYPFFRLEADISCAP